MDPNQQFPSQNNQPNGVVPPTQPPQPPTTAYTPNVQPPVYQNVPPMSPQPQMAGMPQPAPVTQGKSFKAAWLLSLLLGFWGIDRFYMGKIGTGILKFLTGGGYGIWWIIDVILILTGKAKTKKGEPLANRPSSVAVPTVISVIVLLIVVPAYIGIILLFDLTFLNGVQQNAKNNGTSFVVQPHSQYGEY